MWRWCAPPTGRRGFRPTSSRSSSTWDGNSDEADVVVCRAGATTLAEITAAGKAAVLIPLPTATDDHQRKNAEALAVAGAAELLLQRELTGEVLAARVLALAGDRIRRGRMSRRRRARSRGRTRRGSSSIGALELVEKASVDAVRGLVPGAAVLGKTRHVHFVGIGGIGMSGIAELLANLGYVRQRIGREAIGGHRAAERRSASASTWGTTPRTSATPTSW